MLGLVAGWIPARPRTKRDARSRAISESLSSKSTLVAPARGMDGEVPQDLLAQILGDVKIQMVAGHDRSFLKR
jgi:hypothetical protein